MDGMEESQVGGAGQVVVPERVEHKVHAAAGLDAGGFVELWLWPVVSTASSHGRLLVAQDTGSLSFVFFIFLPDGKGWVSDRVPNLVPSPVCPHPAGGGECGHRVPAVYLVFTCIC